ncbi:MAG: TrkH family potassium uptake protein [Christensenellaceae bacterium]|jgi:trk system potassium uptake protein TrkH|nr:TrkH family potassium uptake protein [Christensenellaceae bacterium]
MNYRLTAKVVGISLLTEAGLLLIPLLVAFLYHESVVGFAITIALLLLCGGILVRLKIHSREIYAREGFAAVALTWVLLSAFGALPFVLEGAIPNYFDAFFETVSGFTTTGASILTDVEAVPRGLIFWRSFTHWIGGMGVLVFIMAILPLSEQQSMHIMRAEVPGPQVSKLVPKLRSTAAILYRIYIFLTLIETGLLLLGGMSLFDALVHAFGTAGTGGFGIWNTSVGYYNSAYIDVVIGVFMVLFAMNFNLYFFLLLRQWRSFFKNEELHWFLGIVTASTLLIAANIHALFPNFLQSLRYAFFQVSSIISTTGYATTDFSLWPQFSRCILILLMFIGGCAGSTGGGIKVSRCILLVKSVAREMHQLLHPRSMRKLTLEGKPVPDATIHSTLVFFAAYMVVLIASVLLVSLDGVDFTSTFTAVLSCLSNIGPGLDAVGPAGNFSIFSNANTLLLSLDMLLGRLEIFPMLLLFTAFKKRG